MTKYMNLSVERLHLMLVNKEVTALDLVEDAINGVKEDKCNCFEATCFDKAREEAKKITEVKEDEYFKGIPYLCKDNYSTKGVETSASSNILNGYVPIFDATVVSKMRRKGMIMIAHTTMDELAMGGTGTTGRKGVTTNPYDRSRIVGGSSCGSAAALAQGIAPIALGSDTGDSVRKPASNANLVGFKPTWGLISRFGLYPFAPSLDTIAYFTRNVTDSAHLLTILQGHDNKDMSSASRSKIKYERYLSKDKSLKRIGYFKAVKDAIKDEEIKKAFDQLLSKLVKEGYEVVPYDYPEVLLNALYPTYMIISCAEATSNNANLDGIKFGPTAIDNPQTFTQYMTQVRTKGFSDLIKRRFVIGSFSLLSDNQFEMFSRAQKARRLIVDEMDKFFDSIDYLISPASFAAPKKIKDLSTAWSTDPDFLDNILTIGNFGGYPSITLPFTSSKGMPIGVNITSRAFEDEKLLALAKEVEDITGMKDLTVKEVR